MTKTRRAKPPEGQESSKTKRHLNLVLDYNLAPHPMLAKYQNNQEKFHVVENGVTYYVVDGQKRYYFDHARADLWIEFIENYCRHSIGKWQGELVELAEWQKWIIREYFGWLCCDTGFRRFKYLYLFVPRKNGKTLLMSCLALGLLLIDGEKAPEIYCIGSSDDQARTLFEMTQFMCQYEPEDGDNPLAERTEVQKKTIVSPRNGGKIVPLPFRPDGFHGKNPSTIFLDELHVHPDNGMKRVGETGMGTRDQGNVIMITTAGQRVGTFDHDELKLARQIRDGALVAENYLACIFEPEEGWAWDDIETAKAVNPMYGISLPEKFFRDEIAAAKHTPSNMLEYKQLQLNMYVQSVKIWMPYEVWIKGKKAFDFRQFRGEPIYWGLDLASIKDLSALVLLRRPPPGREDDYWYCHAHFWCPAAAIESKRGTFLPYEYWKQKRYLIETPGASTDYQFIRQQIGDYGKAFDLNLGHADPWNATELLNQLKEQDGFKLDYHRQGFQSMNEPVKFLMGLVLNEQLIHNNPILDWMSSNAITVSDAARNLKFDKVKDDEKIDGVVALAMAVGASLRRDDNDDPFARRGLLVA